MAGLLSLWAVVLGQIVVLFGTAGIAAWLLTQQYRFTRLTTETTQSLSVTQTPSRSQVPTGETTVLSVTMEATDPLALHCSVTPRFPPGSESDSTGFALERGENRSTHTVEVMWPVAGTHTIEPPELTLRDRLGLFEQSITVGTATTVSVQPRGTQNLHVGEGGDPIAAGLGDHETGQSGSGLEPEEVRKYVPGDTIRNIDWKATARLGEPHVREFETETDRETVLFVDHRESLETGQPGETKLDYLRQVGLAFVENAREHTDPLGCYTVGDEGITGSFTPSADTDQQLSIRHQLQSLAPTERADEPDRSTSPTAPARAQQLRGRLADDETAFGTRLAPYFDRPNAYVESVLERPLVGAVKSATAGLDGSIWSVILTDDQNRTELREAVKLARRNQGRALVFIAPTVLYEPGGLGTLDDAHDQYMDFERFRQSLASMDRVTAFEVGPADRVSAVLARGREQWSRTRRN
ncbi:DUF58 domain-containing protein [Halosimplex rubrum]|uniref:DUF58 domain-containing protein n=1 Tax=Halosimplex rubrum TaxID=869889 RepID=A0A7D5TMX2_9EURY|nr:DUF58 domain-containing protein [Halosimplex rubrum]